MKLRWLHISTPALLSPGWSVHVGHRYTVLFYLTFYLSNCKTIGIIKGLRIYLRSLHTVAHQRCQISREKQKTQVDNNKRKRREKKTLTPCSSLRMIERPLINIHESIDHLSIFCYLIIFRVRGDSRSQPQQSLDYGSFISPSQDVHWL